MNNDVIWIDSHAHLSMFDRDEVAQALDRASRRSVLGVLVPATGREDIDSACGLARDFPDKVVAAAGLHPHEAASLDAGLKRQIESSLEQPGVVAVGEIGLDYHYMNSPREDQLSALEWQLDLAVSSRMPVILHNRESWSDLESRLALRAGTLEGVCHSFAEGPEEALKVMELGLWIGISGMVTFKAADNIRKMVAVVDHDRVLVETDSPFLAPVPHRGQRNEPSYVPLVGERLAEEWQIPVADLAASSTAGFQRLFGVGQNWPR